MYKFYKLLQVILFLIISSKVYGFSSSSYLIANTAISLHDYQKASIYYKNLVFEENNLSELKKKLLIFTNVRSFEDAVSIAEEILIIDKANQEAWIIYLINAKLNNNNTPFVEFKQNSKKYSLDIVNYIFYNQLGNLNNSKECAKKILDIANASNSLENDDFNNYNYLIFYLILSLTLDNDLDEASFYLASLYNKIGNFKKSEFYYNEININHFLYYDSQRNISINKIFIGKEIEAEKKLLFLIKENPFNKYYNIILADFYRAAKRYEKSIDHYSIFLNDSEIENIDLARLFYLRGVCYEKINNWDLAEKDFLESLKIKPNSPKVLNYLAYGWIERGIFLDKSLDMLEIAYEKNPNSYYILDSLAWAYFKKKDYIKAANLMEKVIAMAPQEVISIDHLGDIYFEMGRKREASYMWKQAKDLASPEDNILESIIIKLQNI